MPNLTFHFAAGHTRVDVDYGLRGGGGLNICLLQLPATVEEALVDNRRPVAVNAIRDLLIGGANHPQPALQQLMPGGGPVLIVASEYALGSGDWEAVDEIVRSSNRPIIVITGFGATFGETVLDWQANSVEGGTERLFGWRQDEHSISDIMRLNGGWCWIHDPNDSTQCIVYLKNVLEQGVEAVALPDRRDISASPVSRSRYPSAHLC